MAKLQGLKGWMVTLLLALTAWADGGDAGQCAEQEAALARAKITLIGAIETAIKEVGEGKAYEAELEMEDGRPVYSVGMVVGERCVEVEIDAVTGRVLSVEDETAEGKPAAGRPRRWTFDRDRVGAAPAGWTIEQNNPTRAMARWTVEPDPTAPGKPNVLTVRTENGNATFNLAIVNDASYKDLDLSVRVRARTGKDDQGGGLLWRVQDANNYYICRINPLESNYRVYKVVDGKRVQLQSAEAKTEAARWYALRVVMIGDHITCFLDGRKLLDVKDDTFKNAGRIGLWTKADASSSFDDLTARPVRAEGPARPVD